MSNIRLFLISVLILMLVCGVTSAADLQISAEQALPLKTISEKIPLTEIDLAKTLADFQKRPAIYPEASVDSAKIEKGTITFTSTAKPRESGGITIELFCTDNTGRYMPIWGGDVTEDKQSWTITVKDTMRKDVEGCYFAVVDSTEEMMVK